MRVLPSIALFIILVGSAQGADTAHEEAARRFYGAWMNVDRPRMVQGLAAAMGSASPDARALVLEALESPELETVYVKYLVRTFSIAELGELYATTQTPGFKMFNERMPMLAEQLLPEVVNFYRNNLQELSRRVAEKRKAKDGG